MNFLLDECVPARFARSLVGHSVTTVQKRGWAGIKNGDLLALAEKEFDAFVTVDRELSTQQDLTKFLIPVLLIRARTNRLEHIRSLASELLQKSSSRCSGRTDYYWPMISLNTQLRKRAWLARSFTLSPVAP